MPQQTLEETAARAQLILDAAAARIIHYGYDKTTMSDIAEQANVTRAIVYLHFDSKEALFEALLYRETRQYLETWLTAFESDSNGTIAAVFRSALYAANRSPLLSALMKQDRHVFGKYLSKPNNIFTPLQSHSLWPELLKELQAAGAVRTDIQPAVMGHLMTALALGLITLQTDSTSGAVSSFDALLEAAADMMDRVFTPDDGGNQAAGKAIIQRLAQAVRFQFEHCSLTQTE